MSGYISDLTANKNNSEFGKRITISEDIITIEYPSGRKVIEDKQGHVISDSLKFR